MHVVFQQTISVIYISIVCVCVFAEVGLFHSIGREDLKSNVINLSIFWLSVETLLSYLVVPMLVDMVVM